MTDLSGHQSRAGAPRADGPGPRHDPTPIRDPSHGPRPSTIPNCRPWATASAGREAQPRPEFQQRLRAALASARGVTWPPHGRSFRGRDRPRPLGRPGRLPGHWRPNPTWPALRRRVGLAAIARGGRRPGGRRDRHRTLVADPGRARAGAGDGGQQLPAPSRPTPRRRSWCRSRSRSTMQPRRPPGPTAAPARRRSPSRRSTGSRRTPPTCATIDHTGPDRRRYARTCTCSAPPHVGIVPRRPRRCTFPGTRLRRRSRFRGRGHARRLAVAHRGASAWLPRTRRPGPDGRRFQARTGDRRHLRVQVRPLDRLLSADVTQPDVARTPQVISQSRVFAGADADAAGLDRRQRGELRGCCARWTAAPRPGAPQGRVDAAHDTVAGARWPLRTSRRAERIECCGRPASDHRLSPPVTGEPAWRRRRHRRLDRARRAAPAGDGGHAWSGSQYTTAGSAGDDQ